MSNLNPAALQSYVDKYGITRYGTIDPNPGVEPQFPPGLAQAMRDSSNATTYPAEDMSPYRSGYFNGTQVDERIQAAPGILSTGTPLQNPSVPGATPGIAPPALISAQENAEIDAQIAAQQGVAQQPPKTQEAPPTNKKEPYQMSFAEKMGRYGGNIMNAKGGMAQVGAMGSTAAEIYEAERAQNQQIEENEVARMTNPSKAGLEAMEQMRSMDETRAKFGKALSGFIKYGDTVTGPIDSRYQAFKDKTGLPLPGGAPADPERAAFLLSLQDIIVNDTLIKTAMTKGAISNAEMELFQRGIPTVEMQEDVWIAWLTARRQNIEMIQDRIRNGTRVGLDSGIGFSNSYTVPSQSAPVAAPSAFSQEELDLMSNNTPQK